MLHKLGASSLAPFKYPTIIFRRPTHSTAPKRSDQYYDSTVIEGLRLMSLLKCVHFLLTPSPPPLLCSTMTLTGAPRHPACPASSPSPFPPPPPPPQIQTRVRAHGPPAPPKDQLTRSRDPRLHTPEFCCSSDPRLRRFSRRSESR